MWMSNVWDEFAGCGSSLRCLPRIPPWVRWYYVLNLYPSRIENTPRILLACLQVFCRSPSFESWRGASFGGALGPARRLGRPRLCINDVTMCTHTQHLLMQVKALTDSGRLPRMHPCSRQTRTPSSQIPVCSATPNQRWEALLLIATTKQLEFKGCEWAVAKGGMKIQKKQI